MKRACLIVFLVIFAGCTSVAQKPRMVLSDYETAVFAGGCFWCVEKAFESVEGVVEVVSGYTGGHVADPSYEQVSSQATGHLESIKVYYDSSKVSYKDLLDVFWRNVDPTDAQGQFVDRGQSYTTAIFYKDDNEKHAAQQSKQQLSASNVFDKPIVTPILPAKEFYPAEEYHQDYYQKHPIKYKYYYVRSKRPGFFDEHWKPRQEQLREKLTSLQYKVTQEDATEPAFNNEYWNETREGIYVDIVSGEPLFSSKDKYKSGTGWPSFTKPLELNNIVLEEDRKLFATRTEVRSKNADSHLGHVFDDGPPPTGKRWCMNSAALRFIPKSELEKEGYAEYAKLFD